MQKRKLFFLSSIFIFSFLLIFSWAPKASAAPPTMNYFITTSSSVSSGGTVGIYWSSSNASYCSASANPSNANWSGYLGTSGSINSSSIYSQTTFYITCYGSGQVSSNTTVTVSGGGSPPVVNSFTANPTSVASGGSSTLTWNVSNATDCDIDQGVGDVPHTSGNKSQVVSNITSTKTYTLTLTTTGKFAFEESKDKARVCKVTNKKILKGKKIQINLHDGSNFLTTDAKINTQDTIYLDDKGKVTKHVTFDKGKDCFVMSGKYQGHKGKITTIDGRQATVKLEDKEAKLRVGSLVVL